ncbi:toprim domain-containing protein [uncultured Psychromonas sp.]|uniref:toprim domain-containing protein n=1 Tax=uncultured Psychromonas sp. TaxID=173974 RepID=UPI00260A3304|nr:toprim domain-containing protein [uncultured Psychromonas sp.]
MNLINARFIVKDAFVETMEEQGIKPHNPLNIEADGKIKRFRVQGDKSGTKNGWYVLFDDGLLAGSFGNWKTGFTCNWCSKNKNKLSKREEYNLKLQRKRASQIRDKQHYLNQQQTAVKCGNLWESAIPVLESKHPYLLSKQISPYGIRSLNESLLIPLQNTQNQLVNIQFIMPDGRKVFKTGGRVKGCFNVIGELKGDVFICEGYATGSTIHQATGKSVIVALNAGNLDHVIFSIKTAFDLKITIAADNDHQKPVNTGLDKGFACANKYNLTLIYPKFSKDQIGSDFNDLMKLVGYQVLSTYFNAAREEVINE